MPTYSFQSSSASFSSSTGHNGQQTGQTFHQTSRTTPEGTTTRTTTQNLGERPVTHTQQFDARGRELTGSGGADRRIEDVSDQQESEADRLYRERIEDEYAKREGGA